MDLRIRGLHRSVAQSWEAYQRWLFAPLTATAGQNADWRAPLFASLMVVTSLVLSALMLGGVLLTRGAVVAEPEFAAASLCVVGMIASAVLAVRGHFHIALLLTLTLSSGVVFYAAVATAEGDLFYYLPAVILFASPFLALRGMLLLVMGQFALVAVYPAVVPAYTLLALYQDVGAFVAINAAIIAVAATYRSALERARAARAQQLEADQARAYSERDQAQRALTNLAREMEQQARLLDSVLSSTTDMIGVYDREGRLTYVNRAGLGWFGYAFDDVLARRPAEVEGSGHNAATWEALTQALDQAFTSGITVTFEAMGVVSPREPARDFEAVVSPIADADGRRSSAVVVARDITARKQGEAQRLKLALESERMQLMSRFFEAVSHDFRTSLTIIETNRFLLATQLDAEQREALSQRLSRIQESVLRMEAQIDNLSALASLSAMRETPFDLNGVAQAAISEMEVHSRQKGHTLASALADARLMILGDPQHMRRALSELLRNAINFTPPGGAIAVRVVLAHDSVGAPEARVEIADNGIGITGEQLPRIFDLFYRADPARAIESGGIGLGLSIAEIIVNAHNGRITVSSIPGSGSTFTVHLPIPTDAG